MSQALRDGNRITVALGQSNTDATVTLPFLIDSVTGRLLTSGATSLTVITISGTIDDTNTAFTALSQPTILFINGAAYQQTGGAITWSYSSGNITLSNPVGSGGSIFGL